MSYDERRTFTPPPVNLTADTRFLIEWLDRRFGAVYDAIHEGNDRTERLARDFVACQARHEGKDSGANATAQAVERRDTRRAGFIAPMVGAIVGAVAVTIFNLLVMRR